MCTLGTEPRSSARTASDLNPWAPETWRFITHDTKLRMQLSTKARLYVQFLALQKGGGGHLQHTKTTKKKKNDKSQWHMTTFTQPQCYTEVKLYHSSIISCLCSCFVLCFLCRDPMSSKGHVASRKANITSRKPPPSVSHPKGSPPLFAILPCVVYGYVRGTREPLLASVCPSRWAAPEDSPLSASSKGHGNNVHWRRRLSGWTNGGYVLATQWIISQLGSGWGTVLTSSLLLTASESNIQFSPWEPQACRGQLEERLCSKT